MKKKYIKPRIKFYLQSKDELANICCEKHDNISDLYYDRNCISFEIKKENDSFDVIENMLFISSNKA